VLVGTTAVTSTAAFVKERLQRFQSEEFLACYASIAATLFSAAFRETPLGRYLVGTFVERARQLDRTAMLRFYEALQDFDIRDQIAAIPHDTLVVAGNEDVTFALSQDVASRIPHAQFVPMYGYGRAVSLEAPEVFTRTVRDFLLDRERGARR